MATHIGNGPRAFGRDGSLRLVPTRRILGSMTAAVFALAVAVVMAIVYGVFSERLDYASVRRRQLDLTAALTACACLVGIVYGATAARTRATPPPAPTVQPTADALSSGENRPADGTDDPSSPAAVAPAVSVRLLAGALEAGAIATADQAADVPAPAEESHEASDRDRGVAEVVTPESVPLATLGAPVIVVGEPLPTRQSPTLDLPTATATAVALLLTPMPTVGGLVTATRPAPTAVPPTQAPPPLPRATPHCGSPSAGQVNLSELSAAADRDGQDLVVRFRARVRNEASFPVTLAEISATALNQVAGSEQYGNVRLADVAIEPGAVITLEGAIVLTKLPPPFGRTELCLSFAVESCGTRAERLVRQCSNVRGF